MTYFLHLLRAHWPSVYLLIGCVLVITIRPMEPTAAQRALLEEKHGAALTIGIIAMTLGYIAAYPLFELWIFGNKWLIDYQTKKLESEELILSLLTFFGETSGLDLYRYSNGALHRASVYIILFNMEDAGYVSSREEPGELDPRIGIKRKLFSITEAGKLHFRTVARKNMKRQFKEHL